MDHPSVSSPRRNWLSARENYFGNEKSVPDTFVPSVCFLESYESYCGVIRLFRNFLMRTRQVITSIIGVCVSVIGAYLGHMWVLFPVVFVIFLEAIFYNSHPKF